MNVLRLHGGWNTHPYEMFVSRVRVQENGCWEWVGALLRGGSFTYGSARLAGKNTCAHRVSWTLFRGPIPDGLVIDHLCGNTLCVNPAHLEPVTQRENLMRGETLARAHAEDRDCGFAGCKNCARFHRVSA